MHKHWHNCAGDKGYVLATQSTTKFAILEPEVTEALAVVQRSIVLLEATKNHNGGRCNANYDRNQRTDGNYSRFGRVIKDTRDRCFEYALKLADLQRQKRS
jgi:hypothetical protein